VITCVSLKSSVRFLVIVLQVVEGNTFLEESTVFSFYVSQSAVRVSASVHSCRRAGCFLSVWVAHNGLSLLHGSSV
jgi:hypothetical protein